MKVNRFHHVSVNTNGTPLTAMIDFYRDVLGLGDQPRPEIAGIPGHWHIVGNQELHLVAQDRKSTRLNSSHSSPSRMPSSA